jgi:hypothetical protein
MPKKFIRICPECNSSDIKPDMSADSYSKGLLNQWQCNNCGYTGLFFPEYTQEDLKKIKEKNRELRKLFMFLSFSCIL